MKTSYFIPKLIIYLLLILGCQTTIAQNIAINATGATPDASTMLDVSSTSKGLLIPRVNLASMTDASTISAPATSLLIYNTNTSTTATRGAGYYFNAGSSGSPAWVKLVTTTDTVVQTVTPSGDIIKLARFPMGEVSMNGNATITNVPSSGIWTKVAGTTTLSTGSYEFSNGGTNNRLTYTGNSEKMFHIACTISVKATTDGQTMKAVIYKNGVALTAGIVQTKMLTSSDIISTAIHVMTNLAPTDYLELWITNISGNQDFTVTEMNLFAMGVSMGMD